MINDLNIFDIFKLSLSDQKKIDALSQLKEQYNIAKNDITFSEFQKPLHNF